MDRLAERSSDGILGWEAGEAPRWQAAARREGLGGGVADRLRASSAPPSASAPATAWATESASSAGLDHDRPTVQQAERRPGVDNLIDESSNIFPVGAAAQVRWRRREHRDELLSVIFCGESSSSGGGGGDGSTTTSSPFADSVLAVIFSGGAEAPGAVAVAGATARGRRWRRR